MHDWSMAKFHELCDNQGPTITIMKSKAGRIFGGFTNLAWESPAADKWATDSEAFIFSIDRLQVYPVIKQSEAVWIDKGWGPNFGCSALGLADSPLNKENGGRCFTNGSSKGKRYGIPMDS